MMGRPKVENSRCSPQLDSAMRAPSEAHGTGARAWWKSIARIDRICQRCFFVCVLFLQRSDLETAGSQRSIPIGSVAIRLLFFFARGDRIQHFSLPARDTRKICQRSQPPWQVWLGADPAQSGPAHEDARSAWGYELSQAKRCSRSRDAPEDGERLASGASD
jgi:hypothetical protein